MERACVAVEMLPHLEAEAAARRKATQIKDGKPPAATQKFESPSDRNEQMAAAQAAKVCKTNRQYVADAMRGPKPITCTLLLVAALVAAGLLRELWP